tara:strand:- start:134 stop:343 length:210 start_codon:yes stop_codon:yes gene_type:complete
MAKSKIDEGVIKYVIKFFFRGLEKKLLKDPEVKGILRNISKNASAMNDDIRELEKLTGKDLSNLYLKHK